MISRLAKNILIISLIVTIFGCTNKEIGEDYADSYTKQTRDDIIDAFSNKNKDTKKDKKILDAEEKSAPIPQISNMLSFPKPPKFTQGNQIISFSVTQNIDLKDVLIELGRVTNLDVDIDPNISGGIILSAQNRPLIEIIERISKLGGLRYSFENDVLNFKKDIPYDKHYVVDYLVDGALWGEVMDNLDDIIDNNGDSDSSIKENKSAGLITIFSNDAGQMAAQKYLKQVKKTASAQVLIEAKVIEVALTDNFNTGIDWSSVGTHDIALSSTNTNPNLVSGAFTTLIPGKGSLGDITISALEEFGSVRAISSPRINSLNNQKAILNFLDKLVFFTIESDTSTSGSISGGSDSSVTSTKEEEPVGVELEITPSINIDDQEVTLYVKSTISIKSDDVTDPAVALSLALNDNGNTVDADTITSTSLIPVVQTREIETTMNINSGGTLVIGGLMKEDATNTQVGIPFLGRIPFLGHLFKYTVKNNKTVETVILIKATIIPNN